MSVVQHIYPLKGKVQHYAWGGYEYIPSLLSINNSEQKPFAEYWLGAHPNHPSIIRFGAEKNSLDQFINSYPEVLGTIQKQFNSLPFLLKVLDVRQMLSIQVHPDKKSAEIGFNKENELGIPLTASNRNYKDDNHKPEMMVALSDFWLLHGFKPADKLIEMLSAIPDFIFLLDEFQNNGYKSVYEKVMLMDQQEVNKILKPVIERIVPLYKNGELLKSQESFWAGRAAETFCKNGNYDRGIFSIYFFNLVYLKTGEAIYQGAQLPHAYLEGQNVELMANSDNVLRAGLTDKHIDVNELLKHVAFVETVPNILSSPGELNGEVKFETPASEFELYMYEVKGSKIKCESQNAEIILILNGNVSIACGFENLSGGKGDAFFIVANTSYHISSDNAEIYRAAVPL
jgi:mannose-6-phosphate isomerase